MSPVRIQRMRTKGWRMPENTIYVGRPTIFGSPFRLAAAVECGFLLGPDDPHGPRFLTDCYRQWLHNGAHGRDWWQGPDSERRKAAIRDRLHELRGKNLACWCRLDQPCHADVLLEIADS